MGAQSPPSGRLMFMSGNTPHHGSSTGRDATSVLLNLPFDGGETEEFGAVSLAMTMSSMDAAIEPPWMGSRRVSARDTVPSSYHWIANLSGPLAGYRVPSSYY